MYKVYWAYRVSAKTKTIQENLTKRQAMKIVRDDQKTNPSTKVKMMCFGKM